MNESRNALCRWWGHHMDEIAAHYYAHYECLRCGKCYDQDYGIREKLYIRIYLLRTWLHDQRKAWAYWWLCSDCGGRFGRHDESADHIPF